MTVDRSPAGCVPHHFIWLRDRSMAEIREMTAGDYSGLSLFLSGFEGDTGSPDHWTGRFRHWWDKNPAFSAGIARGWVIEDRGAITGFLGNIPSYVYFPEENKNLLVFSSTTWRVLPEYRKQSIALLERQLRACRGSILFNTTPSEAVRLIFDCMKFDQFELSTGIGYSLLNPWRVLSSKMKKRTPYRFAAALCYPALKIWHRLGTTDLRRTETSPNVACLQRTDSSFDRLWERTRSLSPAGVRSAETVNWFCFGNRSARKHLFGYYESGDLMGYAVFSVLQSDSIKNFICQDLWTLPGREWVVRPLIRRARKEAERTGSDLLTVLHPAGELGGWTRKCFLINRNKPFRVYYKTGSALEPRLRDKPVKIFGQGDHGL